jgi:hypothetical protein
MKDIREELELVLEQVNLENKYEKDHMDRLKKRLVVAYDKITKSVQIAKLKKM